MARSVVPRRSLCFIAALSCWACTQHDDARKNESSPVHSGFHPETVSLCDDGDLLACHALEEQAENLSRPCALRYFRERSCAFGGNEACKKIGLPEHSFSDALVAGCTGKNPDSCFSAGAEQKESGNLEAATALFVRGCDETRSTNRWSAACCLSAAEMLWHDGQHDQAKKYAAKGCEQGLVKACDEDLDGLMKRLAGSADRLPERAKVPARLRSSDATVCAAPVPISCACPVPAVRGVARPGGDSERTGDADPCDEIRRHVGRRS